MSWGALFERAAAFDVSESAVRQALAHHREAPDVDDPPEDAEP